jgi:hypothetical protein
LRDGGVKRVAARGDAYPEIACCVSFLAATLAACTSTTPAASYMTPVPSQITTQPAVEMRIGRLEYFDGVSTLHTADRFMRTSFSCAVEMS